MIYDRLKKLDRLPMHMPGHKRNRDLAPYLSSLGAEIDITEIDGYDDLHHPDGMIAECMELAAALWGSRKAFLLINGSTCGILAAIRTMTKRGDKIIMTRGAHKSVFHAVELCGLVPVFIMPPVLDHMDILGSISPESIEQKLVEHPDARLVLLTSPTYEGIISDISGICSAAHRRGVPVVVDEAHGAHLGLGGGFPAGAVSSGADIVIHSLHKTLPSLTQTAMLHVGSELVDIDRLAHQLSVFETSSPSYLLMSSIDGCVRLLEQERELLSDWSKSLDAFDERIKPLEGLRILGHSEKTPAYAFDRSKLPIYTGDTELSGYELASLLRDQYAIEPEYASPRMVLCMTGPGDTDRSLSQLAKALLETGRHCCCRVPQVSHPISSILEQTEMTTHPEKALEADSVMLPLEEAVGHICAEYVWAYPPGIPLLIPGERISAPLRALLSGNDMPELRSTSGKIPSYIRALA